jgi:hypothetical protein
MGFNASTSGGAGMKDLVEYLKKYNAWRRGEDDCTMEEADIKPKELGEKIDEAIKCLELMSKHSESERDMMYEKWAACGKSVEHNARVAFNGWQYQRRLADELLDKRDKLELEVRALEKERDEPRDRLDQLQDKRDRAYDDMLNWRGIDRAIGDKPCHACGGSGIKIYGSSSTWRGGIGGCVITSDICDSCWGSGNSAKPWLDLRQKAQE